MKVFCDRSGITLKQYKNSIVKELVRKSIHLCSAIIPFFLSKAYWLTLSLLTAVCILYCICELLRLHGWEVPVISEITAAAARKRDENKFVLGPVTLVAGIVVTALLWNRQAYTIGILSLAFGDGLASLAGKLLGKIEIPFTSGKTAAGSLACFAASFCAVYLYSKNSVLSLVIACSAMVIEMLPLKNLDNLFIPVILGFIAQVLLPKI